MIKRHKLTILGAFIGAAIGFLYWYYFNSKSSGYTISNSWFYSTFYFSIMGALIFTLFNKEAA